jgi:hypothetical protein
MLTQAASLTAEVVPMSFSTVVQTLAEHAEAERICKLLQWVYTGRWESPSIPLGQSVIAKVLPELLRRTPSYDILERRLYQAAASLNKPERYKEVAAIILQTCTVLYPSITSIPFVHSSVDPSVEPQTRQTLMGMMTEDPTEDLLPTTTLSQRDRFELRHRVMQQVPPLKVKILLFSVLRHPFSFEPLDWKELKTQSLDVWLAELIQAFPVIDVLESKLFTQAAELKRLDQGIQIADAIIQAVRLEIP